MHECFNGDTAIKISFKGLESDYLDLKEEIERANTEHGTSFELESYQPVDGVDIRLEKVKNLVNKAKSHEKFAGYLEDNIDAKKALEEAFNNDFDAYVVATMSSGKSTFINAMLGTALLPARNEATTATIAKIFDTKLEHYHGERCDVSGHCLEESDNLTSDILNTWNDTKDTHTINIKGSIYGMQKRENVRLVLTDTPGPNNSRDESHQQLTMSFIQDSKRNPLILYILNATQLGINDDRNLLGLVAKAMNKGGKQAKDRFIFIVNKCDEFDLEKESLDKALNNVRNYLEDNGISNPLVYPVSARTTLLIRSNDEHLTKKERGDRVQAINSFVEEDYNLIKYMPLTSKVAKKVTALKLFNSDEFNTAIKHSGVPAVEMMIDEYIEKYSLPHRLNRAYDVLNSAIEQAKIEEEITHSLQQNESELEVILNTIKRLEEKRDKGFETDSYKRKLNEKKGKLPAEVADKIKELRVDYSETLNRAGNSMRGESDISQANTKLERIEHDVSFKFKVIINELNNSYSLMQDNIREDLQQEYEKYIASIFDDVRDLKIPVLEGLENKFKHLNITVSGTKEDEKSTKQVVVGQKSVSDSKWYNPFSWGRTKLVDIYEPREVIILDDVWKKRVEDLRKTFTQLLDEGVAHIRQGADKIVDIYIEFLSAEFDKQFDAVLAELTEMIQDKDKREVAIAQAEQELQWIKALQRELESSLTI